MKISWFPIFVFSSMAFLLMLCYLCLSPFCFCWEKTTKIFKKKNLKKVLFFFSLFFPNIERVSPQTKTCNYSSSCVLLLFYYARSLICFVFSNYYISFFFHSKVILFCFLMHNLEGFRSWQTRRKEFHTHTHTLELKVFFFSHSLFLKLKFKLN